MKWFIASDIHGSETYCRMLVEAFEKEKADKILLLGDILYHAPGQQYGSHTWNPDGMQG